MECINQKELYLDVAGVSTLVSVPCGTCIPCLMNKRAEWCFRLEQEHRVSKSAFFVTLTYDQKHLRTNYSLCKRDLQLYLKRVRKKYGNGSSGIRYYVVGEYGSVSGRPHYHAIVFNSDEKSLRQSWIDVKGKPIGIVHIGRVTGASISYVTKYCIQKNGAVLKDDQEKPFATMSRRYGIGGHYLSDNMVAWHRENDANYVVRPGGEKATLARFYKSKIWYDAEAKLRIGRAALAHVNDQKVKACRYWQEAFGARWQDAMAESRNLMLARVRTKIEYSQTI